MSIMDYDHGACDRKDTYRLIIKYTSMSSTN